MTRGLEPEFRELVRTYVAKGWTLERGTKHYRLRHPNGCRVGLPGGRSDWRALKNTIRDLKRCECPS